MPLDIDLTDVLEAHGRTLIAGIHTAVPAIVRSYNASTQTADVQPVNRRQRFDKDGKREYLPDPAVSPNTPVVWPGGGRFFMSMPLEAGDEGVLVYSETSIAEWYETGEVSSPRDARRCSPGHGLFIPGLWSKSRQLGDASSAKIVIGEDGGVMQISIDSTSITLGTLVPGKVAIDSAGVTLGGPLPAGVATALTTAPTIAAFLAWATALNAVVAALVPGSGVADPTGSLVSAVNTTGGALSAAVALPTNFSLTVKAGS